MRDFVTSYYNALPAQPNDAWTKPDPHCQSETGQTQSVTVVSISPRDASSVTARLIYVRRDGTTDTEDRWLRMNLVNGAVLLDESERIDSAPAAAPPLAIATATPSPATQIVTVVAVNAQGQPINGYQEQPPQEPGTTLNGCVTPAGTSLTNGVYNCSPYAVDAATCWPASVVDALPGRRRSLEESVAPLHT